MGVEGLLFAGMVLATALCVAGAALEALAWRAPYAFWLHWQAAFAVAGAGLAALCLSALKGLVR